MAVNVVHTHHLWTGDTGRYFFFDANEFSAMLGATDWDAKPFDIVQKGNKGWQKWSGSVFVWKGENIPENVEWKNITDAYGNSTGHGRRNTEDSDNQWSSGDTLQLESCIGMIKSFLCHVIYYGKIMMFNPLINNYHYDIPNRCDLNNCFYN